MSPRNNLKAACALGIGLGALSLHGQTSSGDRRPLDLVTVQRYASNEMWDEASAALTKAAAADEFNSDVRFALGSVLLKTGRVEEAVKQLGISRRLDTHNWRALEALGDANRKVWEGGGSLSNRMEACSLYAELAFFRSDDQAPETPLIASFALQPDTLEAAAARARLRSRALESLGGTWEWSGAAGGAIQLFGTVPVENHWLLESRAGSAKSSIHLIVSEPGGEGRISGEGLYYMGGCALNVRVQGSVSECSSKLHLEMIPTGGYVALDGDRRVCAQVSKNIMEFHKEGHTIEREMVRAK
jgi:hypothetical protein